MTKATRHHYQVERWDLEGRITQRRCFASNPGALAYLAAESGGASTFKVYCVTAAQCTNCGPSWQPPAWAVDLDERDANARYGIGG